MEFLDGTTLMHLICNGPIELERLLGIGTEITDALDAAHLEGIVHRHVKPVNINDAVMRDGWADHGVGPS
jgi:serine/threonine protein kinase